MKAGVLQNRELSTLYRTFEGTRRGFMPVFSGCGLLLKNEFHFTKTAAAFDAFKGPDNYIPQKFRHLFGSQLILIMQLLVL